MGFPRGNGTGRGEGHRGDASNVFQIDVDFLMDHGSKTLDFVKEVLDQHRSVVGVDDGVAVVAARARTHGAHQGGDGVVVDGAFGADVGQGVDVLASQEGGGVLAGVERGVVKRRQQLTEIKVVVLAGGSNGTVGRSSGGRSSGGSEERTWVVHHHPYLERDTETQRHRGTEKQRNRETEKQRQDTEEQRHRETSRKISTCHGVSSAGIINATNV
jgi:hypothetical protein